MTHCSKLVKGIHIQMEDINSLQMTAFAYLLSHLGALESVKIDEGDYETLRKLARTVQKHQIGIKHLEIRESFVEWESEWELLNGLETLETFVTNCYHLTDSGIDSSFANLACELYRFVSHSCLTISIFERILHSSWESLVTLAFPINSGHACFDLHRLKNLHTLRIKLEDVVKDSSSRQIQLAHKNAYVEAIRLILRSVQSLSLKTLSVATESSEVADGLVNIRLFDLLPPSLHHFGTNYALLKPGGVNFSEVVKAKRDGRLKHLQKITIYTSDLGDAYESRFEPDSTEERRARHVGEELKISTSFHRIRRALDAPYYTLEPYYEVVVDED